MLNMTLSRWDNISMLGSNWDMSHEEMVSISENDDVCSDDDAMELVFGYYEDKENNELVLSDNTICLDPIDDIDDEDAGDSGIMMLINQ
jgi:hypothetical protein